MLHDHPEAPEGLRYRLKHDPSRIGVAIFDRVGANVIWSQALGTLVVADNRNLLAAILREYGFGLVDGPYVA